MGEARVNRRRGRTVGPGGGEVVWGGARKAQVAGMVAGKPWAGYRAAGTPNTTSGRQRPGRQEWREWVGGQSTFLGGVIPAASEIMSEEQWVGGTSATR